MAGAGLHPVGEQVAVTVQVQEPDVAAAAQDVAVAVLERGGRHDAAGGLVVGDPGGDGLEPGLPVLVVQRVAGAHLVDVRLRMERVRFGVVDAEAFGECRAHGRLARAGNAHHHDDGHPYLPRRCSRDEYSSKVLLKQHQVLLNRVRRLESPGGQRQACRNARRARLRDRERGAPAGLRPALGGAPRTVRRVPHGGARGGARTRNDVPDQQQAPGRGDRARAA